MDRKQRKLIEALDRVEEFLEENAEAVGGAITPPTRQFFQASRDRVLQHMKGQQGSAQTFRITVGRKHALREELVREHMRPIVAVAQAVVPNAREHPAFAIPGTTQSFVAVVAAGYGLAEAARMHEQELLKVGLPSDFIAQLLAATEVLKESISASSQTSGRRVEATTGLETDGQVARKAMRVLDALVRKMVKDKSVLNRWRHIRRVTTAASSPTAPDESSSSNGSGASSGAPTGPGQGTGTVAATETNGAAGIPGTAPDAPAAAA